MYVHHYHMLWRNSKETVWTLFTITYIWCSIYTSYCRKKFRSLASAVCVRIIAQQISGLSRTLHLDFHDQTHFPGPGILQTQFQYFPGGVGILLVSCEATRRLSWRLNAWDSATWSLVTSTSCSSWAPTMRHCSASSTTLQSSSSTHFRQAGCEPVSRVANGWI